MTRQKYALLDCKVAGLYGTDIAQGFDPVVAALAIQLAACTLQYADVARHMSGGRSVAE